MWLSGTRIKEIRKILGESQEVFAKKLGISKGALQNYENGEREPTASIIFKIAEVGNVSLDWLFTGKEPVISSSVDLVTEKILQMLDGMSEDKKRDVLKYTEKEKLLNQLLEERRKKEAA
ncbi:MAG: helix-turn-helix transcriptional regulator [Candidatus Schekmanbacteria bacterium]|nr:helix-turn-helix transcriptional regulator [Candidatus Schekmanbacteria bacterium]